jgi:hypothetical protein
MERLLVPAEVSEKGERGRLRKVGNPFDTLHHAKTVNVNGVSSRLRLI